ncbi:hypothetical protein CALVIDRAFT_540946 [Calocera viscosa TUFC12733]|uniref:BAR domain-containing protein n=1 Tax=Calocera viscosa (strain TUFC12733) TaxID=1330018 RepID=A0A167IBT3_CALVF|nr:hypothetical protein CALVIDRAFT_540946 [Calocera viscosa TUFC12733]
MSKLGKLRKWGKGFVKDLKGPESGDIDPRSTVDEELKSLDEDLSLRRRGLERLLVVSDAYGRTFFKRKDFDDPDRSKPSGVRKMNPQEALGLHLQRYGEAHGETGFGRGMGAYGRARVEVFHAWRQYGKVYNEQYHTALEQGLRQVKEVQAQRKGLEKKKAAHEASYTRMQRARSDKNAEAMEEDVSRSYAAYESMLEEVQSRVLEIEEFEQGLLAQTVQLVEDELEYVNTYREVLLGVKDELGGSSYSPKPHVPKSSSRSSLAPPPFNRRPSARSLHSLSERTQPTHLRTQSHQLKRETSSLSRGQASPMSRGRHWGEWGWSEIAAAGAEAHGEGADEDSLVSPRERGREGLAWGEDDSEDDNLPSASARGAPPKLPSRPPSLGKLQIPALPPRTRPSPLTPGGRSRPQEGYLMQSDDDDEPEHDPEQERSFSGALSDEETGSDLGFGTGGRTPGEERPDPMSARAPALPPRRMNSLRSPPPTPPRRNGNGNGSYAGTPVERRRELEEVKSPFDTTDESDA